MLLTEWQWRLREQQHRARVQPWIQPRLERRRHGRGHPVDDFLFEYYPYSPAKLATWHPGHKVILQGDASCFLSRGDYVEVADGVTLSPESIAGKGDRLDLAMRILLGTRQRPAMVNCFGLHEWAMVYRTDPGGIRHADQPLRVSPDQIAATVEGLGLRCTHIDAFRFFTETAAPMNTLTPTRASQPDLEQAGCLHANMDLYKYAMWFQTHVGSDLVADCFELAREARELDMRASPYDISGLGLEPIPVERADGRAAYIGHQRQLMVQGVRLRDRLIETLGRLQHEVHR